MMIEVTVRTRSKRRSLEKIGEGRYKAYLTEAPVDGKANNSLIELLSDTLGLPKSRLKIIRGIRSKQKIIKAE